MRSYLRAMWFNLPLVLAIVVVANFDSDGVWWVNLLLLFGAMACLELAVRRLAREEAKKLNAEWGVTVSQAVVDMIDRPYESPDGGRY